MIEITLILLLAIFATFRISRLLSRDTILDPLRKEINIHAALPDSGGWYYLAEWINCAHCIGIWVSFFIVIAISIYFRWSFWLGILGWLSVAGGQSFLWSLVEIDTETDNADSQ